MKYMFAENTLVISCCATGITLNRPVIEFQNECIKESFNRK